MRLFKRDSDSERTGNSQATVDDIDDVFNYLKIVQTEVLLSSQKIESINQNIANLFEFLVQEVKSSQKAEDVNRKFEEFKEDIKKKITEELKQSIRSGHHQNNIIVETNTSSVKELNENLLKTRGFMEEILNCQLQEMKIQLKDLMDQRQDLGSLRREIESWQDFAVEFFQYMERTLEIVPNSDGESDQSAKQITSKLVKDFEKFVNRFGLERIFPSPGDDLDENFHKAVDERVSTDVQPGKILGCKTWGYRINGKLYKNKRSEVIVVQAPKQPEAMVESGEVQKESSTLPQEVSDSEQVDEAIQEPKLSEQSHISGQPDGV